MPGHDIVVMGASAGGVETLERLLKGLPADLPTSIFIVVHIGPQSPGMLPSILTRAGKLPAVAGVDNTPIEPSHIYVAPPDCHLLLEHDRVRVIRGPKENLHRPAIDPLFRSAAWSFGPRVVGVVLTGTLDDGASGLWAIKTCGGVTVVQDPADALFAEMPANALKAVDVDHCLRLEGIAPLLTNLAHEPVRKGRSWVAPEKIKTETLFAMMDKDITDMDMLGKPSAFTCPSCRGTLWELQDGQLLRYRCHVGHAFAPESLLLEQAEAVEEALDSALVALEEKAAMLSRLAERWGDRLPGQQAQYQARARETMESATVLRQLLANRKS
jgi:two-component system chemotaxis response regulator CheB